jgi:hypothetical protein
MIGSSSYDAGFASPTYALFARRRHVDSSAADDLKNGFALMDLQTLPRSWNEDGEAALAARLFVGREAFEVKPFGLDVGRGIGEGREHGRGNRSNKGGCRLASDARFASDRGTGLDATNRNGNVSGLMLRARSQTPHPPASAWHTKDASSALAR